VIATPIPAAKQKKKKTKKKPNMSASSGLRGFCKNSLCLHAMNEHHRFACAASGCRVLWVICQSPAHDGWVVCKKCWAHPGGNRAEYEHCTDISAHWGGRS
jgi:hypothetical protein